MYKRLIILCFFLFTQYLYDCTIGKLVGFPVAYFTMAISDALILHCLPMFGYNRLVRDLQHINYFAIKVHCYGFIIYMLYFPPVTYNCAIVALSGLQFIRLFWMAGDDDKHFMGWPVHNYGGRWFHCPTINLQRIFNQKQNR